MSNPRGRAARAMHEVFAPISYHSTQQYACQHACQMLLMRACARRAYCMTENFQRFQRIFNVFCGQVHGKSFDIFLQLLSTAVVIPLLNLVEVHCIYTALVLFT